MYIDKKFTAWFRYYFPSDLKTPEFTSEKEVYDFIDEYSIECEPLYDCESEMSVSDNNGDSTIEVINNDCKVIWKNGN